MKIDINVEVLSKEKIKPSTPTPDHLRHYQFSFLDQTSVSFYIPWIYFYNPDETIVSPNEISTKLKKSLSEVLTQYYVLAGCVKDNSVDCNDEGVLFLEAKCSCKLSETLQEPIPTHQFNKLLPYDYERDGDDQNFALAVQVNFFNCGGFVIGVSVSHRISDGISLITFLKNWAAAARGDTSGNIHPQFVIASLFPPKEEWVSSSAAGRIHSQVEKNIVFKRFVFDGKMISELRKRIHAVKSGNEIYPTRVEALTCFLWSCFVASIPEKDGPENPCMLFHAVNYRNRMHPALPDSVFGNLAGAAIVISSEVNFGEECHDLVNKFRDAISKINKDYIRKLQEGVSESVDLKKKNIERIKKGEMVRFVFTSLCKYPTYDVDFGWGRPKWVARGPIPRKNAAIFIDNECGDGIEAWIYLKDEDMAKFERFLLQKYVDFN